MFSDTVCSCQITYSVPLPTEKIVSAHDSLQAFRSSLFFICDPLYCSSSSLLSVRYPLIPLVFGILLHAMLSAYPPYCLSYFVISWFYELYAHVSLTLYLLFCQFVLHLSYRCHLCNPYVAHENEYEVVFYI